MSSRCSACGHPTEWDQDAGSAVCTTCGTLADPSQSILTTAADFQSDAFARDFRAYERSATLKSVRSTSGWDLAGQSKEARHERNKFTTHESIRTLATRLGHPGVAPRAQALFDLSMSRAGLRWGRPATLAAGASLAFALRESGRGDATHDISYLLSETPTALMRTQMRLLPLLGLTLPRALPTAHLPALVAHLDSVSSALPADTRAFLRPLLAPDALPDVLRTAGGLYDLLVAPVDGTQHPILALPAPPLAPALLILALEAHAHPPRAAPHVLGLAAQLGTRLGLGGRAVMDRYRALGDVVEGAAEEVPWLHADTEGNSQAKKGKGKKGKGADEKAKVARRVGIARAVCDVVQFREEICRRRVRDGGAVEIMLEGELSDGEIESLDGEGSVDLDVEGEDVQVLGKRRGTPVSDGDTASVASARPSRPKRARTAAARASSFLLNPLSEPSRSSSAAPSGVSLSHTAHLLAPDSALAAQPTRLQLLSAERGGEEAITDEELFDEGEIEGMIVAEDDERAGVLRALWGSDADEGAEKSQDMSPVTSREERLKEKESRKGMGRVNVDRLAELLGDPYMAALDEDKDEAEESHEDGVRRILRDVNFDDGGEEVDVGEWAPMSPGASTNWLEDQYDV